MTGLSGPVGAVGDLPRAVRLGAALLCAYGLTVVVSAIVQQTLSGWEYWRDFPRALIRCAGAILVAVSLLRRARWAWWIAIVGGGLIGVLGVTGIAFLAAGLKARGEQLPVLLLVASFVAFVFLGGAVIALLRPESRDVFRARAG